MTEESANEPSFKEEEVLDAARRIRDDPVLFCKSVLGVNPFPYQANFLGDKSKRIIACAGRQIGKSLITAVRAVWFSVTNPGTTTLIVSSTMRQSMLTFQKISKLILDASLLERSVSYKSKTKITFRNGSEIVALPCGRMGFSLRGYTAHQVIMDEAAFMPEDVIAEVLLPTLATTQGTAIMISTPYDKDHIFYKAFISTIWSKHHYPSSINPLITPEYLEEQREIVGEQRYAKEFLAEFVDDELAYFPMALLRNCVHTCKEEKCEYCALFSTDANIDGYVKESESEFFGGYDPGGKRDPAAFVIVEKMKTQDKIFRVQLTKTYQIRNKDADSPESSNLYTRITAEVADVSKRYHVGRTVVDSTGIGLPIVELCKSLQMPIQGLSLNSKIKEELFSTVRILLEQKRLVLPHDLNLLGNLNCIQADRTRAGGFSFSHPQGTHDDLAYALALALHGATKSSGKVVMMKRN